MTLSRDARFRGKDFLDSACSLASAVSDAFGPLGDGSMYQVRV